MKEKIRTDGLVIREHHTGESDRIITVLTRNEGLVRAFATGARKLIGKSASSTGLLCFSDFVFSPSRDSFRVSESSPKEVFFGLRENLEKLSLAQYFCELCGVLCPFDEPAEQQLRLALNCLKFLEEGKLPADQIKAIFEMQLLCQSGYRPDLSGCALCHEGENLFFDLYEGRTFCAVHKSPRSIRLDKDIFLALSAVSSEEMKKAFLFTLPKSRLKILSKITGEYTRVRLERSFKTLEFYESIAE